MDSEETEQLWANVCARIKQYDNIDKNQVDAFFSRLHPQAANMGFIMLSADTDFIKTWIERHYITYIEMALEEICGMPFTVGIEAYASPVQAPQPAAATPMARPAGSDTATNAAQAPTSPVAPPAQTAQPETVAPAQATPLQQQPIAQLTTAHEEPVKEPTTADPSSQSNPLSATEGSTGEDTASLSSFSFENFVVGDSNRMAYSMAVSVAEAPGKTPLNPLFLYGKSGLGKTHLLRSIQNYINRNIPSLKVVYVDANEITNDYSNAVAEHDKDKASFRTFQKRYEDADVLLIDDVQSLQGKKATLNIVFDIFNKLTNQGKQVVLSADRAPSNIDIDERYKTRFNSGGTMDIQPPEIETKLGIVKGYIDDCRSTGAMAGIDIPAEIQMYIAENSSSNVRELKSAVTKVIWQIQYTNQPNFTVADVRALLENHFSGGPSKRLTVEDIQKEAEQFYKVSHADIVGPKRARNITHARQVAIFLCRDLLDIPYEDIGKKFNRDHSTAMYSVRNIEEKMRENRVLREEMETLKQQIRDM